MISTGGLNKEENGMSLSSEAFVKDIEELVSKKHSKDHPIIGMIERGELTREALKGFVGPVLPVFPQAFSQTYCSYAGSVSG